MSQQYKRLTKTQAKKMMQLSELLSQESTPTKVVRAKKERTQEQIEQDKQKMLLIRQKQAEKKLNQTEEQKSEAKELKRRNRIKIDNARQLAENLKGFLE